jgi:putative inorganic carbon (hco3(-)) transporter
MRDILVTLVVFATLPYIFRNAWYGVLVWSWLSYMNPHKMAYGFAYSMPFAQIVAIVLLVAMLANREKLTLPSNRLVTVWVALLIWLGICTSVALNPVGAMDAYIKILKIQAITGVTMILMKDFQKLNQLIWVIVFSIGFFSVKGGVFTITSGGGFHVLGPDGTDIFENNALAVAVLMIIPLMIYLNKFPPHPLVKKIMPFCIALSMFSVVGSQSRGAMLAIAAVGIFFWWKTKNKVFTAVVFVVFATFTFNFMPQGWHERMGTINDYQEDSSSQHRLDAWQYCYNVANARLTGGGFNSWTVENYHRYGVPVYEPFAAHSIYFGPMGDSGWIGFVLFMTILFLIWRQLARVINITEDIPERADYNFLARMLQISVIAYMAGGAFLSLAWFDLPWHLMAITIALTNLTQDISPKESSTKRAQEGSKRARVHRRRRVAGKALRSFTAGGASLPAN